jgi:histidinol dehydrogenase
MRKNVIRQKVTRDHVMRIIEGSESAGFATVLAGRGAADLTDVEPAVRHIVADVKRNGDRAVRRYAKRWDGLGSDEPLLVSEDELHQAWEQTDEETQKAI